jgi:hypothetical protein
MKGNATKAPNTISYRIDQELSELARVEAKKYAISPHELARQVFTDWLMDQERHALAEALGQVREEVAKQRADLREAVIALLCDAGRAERADAEEWVSTHMFQ